MNRSLFLLLLLLLFLLTSCSSTKSAKTLKKELIRGEEHFSYTDKNGQFIVRLSSGFNKKENSFYTKRSLEDPTKDGEKILEQSIVLSELGSVKKKVRMLRPKLSQYTVWFEGKKYFSELKINPSKKAIDIKMVSPEAAWNGVKQIKFPNSKSLYCFFSQVVECAKTSGFLSEAIKKESGTMSFYIIWEGYPYQSETYTDVPSSLFAKAQFEYDGKTKEDETRFNLKVAGQSIFLIVDQTQQMKKMFWVSQGISMISRQAKTSKSDNQKNETAKEGDAIE
jgi:hypothetical protein